MCWNNINITHPCFKHSNSVTSNHSENDDASNGNENTANNKIHQIKAIIIVKLCINKQSFPGFVSQLILYDSAFTTFQKYMSIPITSWSIHQNRRTKTYIESIEYNVRTLIIYKYNLKTFDVQLISHENDNSDDCYCWKLDLKFCLMLELNM